MVNNWFLQMWPDVNNGKVLIQWEIQMNSMNLCIICFSVNTYFYSNDRTWQACSNWNLTSPEYLSNHKVLRFEGERTDFHISQVSN